MLISKTILSELEAILSNSTEQWRVAAVDIEVGPLEFVRAAHNLTSPAVYFGRPGGVEVGAVGSAWETTAAPGEGRFQRIDADLPDVSNARFVLGFSFDEDGPKSADWQHFGPARLVLPKAAVVRDGESTKLVVVAEGGADADLLAMLAILQRPESVARRQSADRTIESVPAPSDWMETIADTVSAIHEGAIEKVVLARSVVVTSDVVPDPFDLAVRLLSGYPECFTYAWESGDGAFVGASPELLASVRDSLVVSEPLAGTTARGEGEDHDRTLGEQLMASAKNRLEHRVVIEDIAKRLTPLASGLSAPMTPHLRRMANVQHLSTRIQGTMHPGLGILDVIDAIHPTPAVGGSPATEAMTMISKLEQIDRGWYAGGVGWIDSRGNGDVAVALRCALLRGATARLYAGAGIVAGSDPQLELDETRLKFGPMLSLLTEA
ncbi:MAG: isochorismate synthase [Acidimicrobiia bacterium]|nr:isochorismate synthase [Acidimicrobiia bacterium]